MILVTGSGGLIGRHLVAHLRRSGIATKSFDTRTNLLDDIRDPRALSAALAGVTGIVHLAAVSRVKAAELDPDLCAETNVAALQTLVDLCVAGARPWLLFASSREVYGSVNVLPVHEDVSLRPINIYGHSKALGEAIVLAARQRGIVANICRFSNVYGCVSDHADRVAMAFAHVAQWGGTMTVTGPGNLLDMTTIDDVVDGICRLIAATSDGRQLPPVHLASGQGTTLRALAELVAEHSTERVNIVELPARGYDVSGFVGNPQRASDLLGWRARTPIRAGMADLLAALKSQADAAGGLRTATVIP